MAKRLDPKQTVDLREVVISEIIQSDLRFVDYGSCRFSLWKKSVDAV